MADLAIRTCGIGKKYNLGKIERQREDLRETLGRLFSQPTKSALKLIRGEGGRDEDERKRILWALQDVSFDVRSGEVMGIIGANGSGKSTLLKILSRVTPPSSGYAEVDGRVGSLLEVGTGFHRELTGRENIYLGGAIFGWSKRNIKSVFDEIVSFAELESALDTRVKYYSSGMYMRLGFSVAAHLQPEIFIIDEILAIGDLAFQAKCMKKIEEIAASAKAVILVSHNMEAVRKWCRRAIWLDHGRIALDGPVQECVSAYEQSVFGVSSA